MAELAQMPVVAAIFIKKNKLKFNLLLTGLNFS
jgi:hypothetical protein